ncbi:MAG TPA: hypothetical protein VMC10_07820 [Stellaceae bacterium]|nr:hypothetical protein [Stellaceae bacterium]
MPQDPQRQSLADAVTALDTAMQQLMQASRAATDPAVMTAISDEHDKLETTLDQLLNAQALADDAAFAAASAALKQKAADLQAEEATIKQIIKDVALAAKIVGGLASAAAFLLKL